MAETIWWCEVTELPYRCSYEIGTSSAVAHDACGSRILSAPGELVDPANVLAYVRTLPGVEEVTLFGPLLVPARHDPQYDVEIEAGRYLVVPLSEEAANG